MQSRLEEKITRFPHIANRKMTAVEALDFMRQFNIRHLPVLEDGKLVGMVTESTLTLANIFQGPGKPLVEDIMDPSPYCVDERSSLAGVIRKMVEAKRDYVLALDADKQIVGIFTTTNALTMLSDFLEGTQDHSSLKVHYDSFLEMGRGWKT